LNHLSGLAELQGLDLSMTRVTDAGVSSLDRFSELSSLLLANTQITDRSLEAIGRLDQLRHLDLLGAGITDVGMRRLSRLKLLEIVDLSRTGIGDDGLAQLADCELLRTLKLANTGVTQASLPLLMRLPNLQHVDVVGSRIIPASFRRAFPELANEAVQAKLGKSTSLELTNIPLADLLEYLPDLHQATIVPSHQAQQVAASDPRPFTAPLQRQPLGTILRKLFTPRGLRPIVRYGCIQLITTEDSVSEQRRMVVNHPLSVSQSLSQQLYRGCPPLDGWQRNALLARTRPQHLQDMVPRHYAWRPEDVATAMQDLGLKTKLDEAAFADRPDLLARRTTVPTRWHTNLSSALECMFDLLDVHGMIQDDTIWIRPGAAAGLKGDFGISIEQIND
jgi:hypothetical protein